MSDLERAFKARSELDETEAAFATVREALIAQLLGTAVGESLMRDKLVLTIQALDQVRQVLLTVASGADIEEHVERLAEAMKQPA